MGCGNSSPATNNSNTTGGQAESSSKASEESAPEDDKWKNYGGVYVGFPTDLSNIPQVQIGSLRGCDGRRIQQKKKKKPCRGPSGPQCLSSGTHQV
ncbi:overexpressed in colon carcinoma 1 protein homolog isoform X1 [Epinephelus moara]|uniref:overexpressed in colon carcinoma 1 protein homolog isoform X1 n=1 Tax=Epinephelus moara TaxID=300413 RepID=UPI00214E6238|nr:overexpressed in colon carcinoma 1 protein homolog isoform X1 [Epinephelus moara]